MWPIKISFVKLARAKFTKYVNYVVSCPVFECKVLKPVLSIKFIWEVIYYPYIPTQDILSKFTRGIN